MILRSVSQTETEKNIIDYRVDSSKHLNRSNYLLVIAIFNCRVFYLSGCCSEC